MIGHICGLVLDCPVQQQGLDEIFVDASNLPRIINAPALVFVEGVPALRWPGHVVVEGDGCVYSWGGGELGGDGPRAVPVAGDLIKAAIPSIAGANLLSPEQVFNIMQSRQPDQGFTDMPAGVVTTQCPCCLQRLFAAALFAA